VISKAQWVEQIAPLHLNSILYRSELSNAFNEWSQQGETLDAMLEAMRFGLQTDSTGHCWIDRSQRPLDLMLPKWLDPINPLANLLEGFKWSALALKSGIPASVLLGQMFHESNKGQNTDSLFGIKATSECHKNGCFKLMRTRETISLMEVERLKKLPVPAPYLSELKSKGYNPQGWYLRTVETMPNGKADVSCLQEFHFLPGMADDLERFIRVYQLHFNTFHKPHWRPGWDARKFLTVVTQAEPAYATGAGYVDSVMLWINKFNLEVLDKDIAII
jgi:hypothetical protein